MSDHMKAANGRYYTRQLFWEEWINLSDDSRSITPLFTLYKDKPNLINLGKEYVKHEDPTGYKVAEEHLGGYTLWTVLMQCRWFVAAKEVWDRELDAKLASTGIEKMKELMVDGLPAQQLAAAKYFANLEHRKDRTAAKGRPTKEAVDKAAREQAAIDKELAEDFQRIRIVK